MPTSLPSPPHHASLLPPLPPPPVTSPPPPPPPRTKQTYLLSRLPPFLLLLLLPRVRLKTGILLCWENCQMTFCVSFLHLPLLRLLLFLRISLIRSVIPGARLILRIIIPITNIIIIIVSGRNQHHPHPIISIILNNNNIIITPNIITTNISAVLPQRKQSVPIFLTCLVIVVPTRNPCRGFTDCPPIPPPPPLLLSLPPLLLLLPQTGVRCNTSIPFTAMAFPDNTASVWAETARETTPLDAAVMAIIIVPFG